MFALRVCDNLNLNSMMVAVCLCDNLNSVMFALRLCDNLDPVKFALRLYDDCCTPKQYLSPGLPDPDRALGKKNHWHLGPALPLLSFAVSTDHSVYY